MLLSVLCLFFFNDTATTEIYTLSLHDALPIWIDDRRDVFVADVHPSFDERVAFGSENDRLRAARARAVAHVVFYRRDRAVVRPPVRLRRVNETDHVLLQRRSDEDLTQQKLHARDDRRRAFGEHGARVLLAGARRAMENFRQLRRRRRLRS